MKMRSGSHLLFLLALFATLTFSANASPTGDILKQLSSVVKWPKPTPKTAQTEGGHVLQFENGYFVETLVEGDKLGVVPHTIRVSPEGELLTVDSINNHIVRITPPLSEYSRGRLVAGSSQGYSGHVDGKSIDARFKHPKGVTMDDKGNVYVADTANMAIRKIGEGGVTTIAGGKSNIAGYRDGPSEDAKFSSDFDLVFLKKTCSLLVIDRGNAALRQISLQQEDCDFPENSVLSSDLVLVVGAILAGYIFCLAQHYFSSLFSQKTKEEPEVEVENIDAAEKEPLVAKSLTDEPSAGWSAFGTLLTDLFKFSVEAIGNMLLNSVPLSLRRSKTKTDLTPLKDRLVMPEDREETTPQQQQSVFKEETTPNTQKLKIPRPLSETIFQTPILQTTPISNNTTATDTPPRVAKASKVPKFKESSLSGKHRSSKRQDFAEFYGMGETGQVGSKGTKERVRHRHREKSGEVNCGQNDSKPEYSDNAKFDHYGSLRSKYGPESAYRY